MDLPHGPLDRDKILWMGVFGRLRESLSRTKQQIVDRFEDIVRQADEPERRSRPVDVETVDALEEVLISADIGVAATERIIAAVKGRTRSGESLRDLVKQEIRSVFAAVDHRIAVTSAPIVILVVGVNGTGKTTTVGKLANLLKKEGRQPLICAADTFRAAAVEQLEIWACRAGVDIVRAKDGADPAAVVFDAITSGKAKGRDPDPHRYRGPPPHSREPDERARQDSPRRLTGGARARHRKSCSCWTPRWGRTVSPRRGSSPTPPA